MENTLTHWGVKGMKWGKRKGGSTQSTSKSDKVKADRKKASKGRRTLSDADLKKRIERIQSEKKLKDLTSSDLAPGRKAISSILSSAGQKTAATVVSGALLYATKAALTKSFSLKEAAAYVAPKPKKK